MKAVSLDIKNALKLKPEYIVFDDYGLSTMGGVKRAVDDFIDNEKLRISERDRFTKRNIWCNR